MHRLRWPPRYRTGSSAAGRMGFQVIAPGVLHSINTARTRSNVFRADAALGIVNAEPAILEGKSAWSV